jgi:acetyl esterase/lipase
MAFGEATSCWMIRRCLFHFILSLSVWSQVSAEIRVEADVVYGEVGGQRLLLDVGLPDASVEGVRPAVVLVHGGGWVQGSKEGLRWLTEGLAREGYVSVAINYRLMKDRKNLWPAQIDDAQRAVRWVRANAQRYGIDPNRIGAFGGSAGGHLASLLGTIDTRDNSDAELAAYSSRVRCVVNMNGPTDLARGFDGDNRPGGVAWVHSLISGLLGGSPADQPDRYREASPLYQVTRASAPFLIVHGRKDDVVPVEQSEWLHAALEEEGVRSKLIIFEDEDHNFTKPANQERFANEMREFYAEQLKQP